MGANTQAIETHRCNINLFKSVRFYLKAFTGVLTVSLVNLLLLNLVVIYLSIRVNTQPPNPTHAHTHAYTQGNTHAYTHARTHTYTHTTNNVTLNLEID